MEQTIRKKRLISIGGAFYINVPAALVKHGDLRERQLYDFTIKPALDNNGLSKFETRNPHLDFINQPSGIHTHLGA